MPCRQDALVNALWKFEDLHLFKHAVMLADLDSLNILKSECFIQHLTLEHLCALQPLDQELASSMSVCIYLLKVVRHLCNAGCC